MTRVALLVSRIVGVAGPGLVLFDVGLVLFVLAFLTTHLRLVSRRYAHQLGLDDYTMAAATLFAGGLTIVNCVAVAYGYGRHQATLHPHDKNMALLLFFLDQIFYKIAILLVKASYLLLFLRLFPEQHFQRKVYAVFVVLMSYGLASIVATFLECQPMEKIWNRDHPGQCFNVHAFWTANAAANLAGNLIIMGLPLHQIWKLQLPRTKKGGLTFVFLLGFVGIGISIYRTSTLASGAAAIDVTYGTLKPTIWTAVEVAVFILAANSVVLRAPFLDIWSRLFTQKTSQVDDSTPLASASADMEMGHWENRYAPSRDHPLARREDGTVGKAADRV